MVMCEYMYNDLPRRHKVRKQVETNPEVEKVEEKPIIMKA